MLKRTLSVLLAGLLVFALTLTAFAADEPTAVLPDDSIISFDANTAGWSDVYGVGFHIWSDDPSFELIDWGSRKQRGSDPDSDGVWQYDLGNAGMEIRNKYNYFVIFYGINSKGSVCGQTYNLLFGKECFGDVAYCTGEAIENPVDSSQSSRAAYWKNQNASVYGPQLTITSIGNVVGSCLPKDQTECSVLEDFLKNDLSNARAYTEMSDQELLDNIGDRLGLYRSEVASVIMASGVDTDWTEENSALPEKEPDPFDPTEPTEPIVGGNGVLHIDSKPDTYRIKKGDTLIYECSARLPAPVQMIKGTVNYDPTKIRLATNDGDGSPAITSPLTGNDMYRLALMGAPGEISFTFTVNGNDDLAGTGEDPIEGEDPDPDAPVDSTVINLPLLFISFDVISGEGESSITTTISEALDINGDPEDLGDDKYGVESDLLVITVEASGDADMDGEVTVMDATRIQRFLAKLAGDDEIDKHAADVDADGDITVMDATRIQRFLAKLCELDGSPYHHEEYELDLIR